MDNTKSSAKAQESVKLITAVTPIAKCLWAKLTQESIDADRNWATRSNRKYYPPMQYSVEIELHPQVEKHKEFIDLIEGLEKVQGITSAILTDSKAKPGVKQLKMVGSFKNQIMIVDAEGKPFEGQLRNGSEIRAFLNIQKYLGQTTTIVDGGKLVKDAWKLKCWIGWVQVKKVAEYEKKENFDFSSISVPAFSNDEPDLDTLLAQSGIINKKSFDDLKIEI